MKLSVKSDYAVRAVFGLAQTFSAGEVKRVEDLAGQQGISAKYLVQILIELKSSGIVRSQRGKEGGYSLARPPSEITMADVLHAVHGVLFEAPALSDTECPQELRLAWGKIRSAVEESAASISFQDLVEAAGSREKMYYI